MKSDRYQVPEGFDSISATELEKYLRCGLRYFLEKERRHRVTTVPLAIGTAVHAAQKHDLDLKLIGEESEADEIIDCALTALEDELETAECASPTYERSTARANTAKAASVYYRRVSPILEPTGAETPIAAELPEKVALVGTVDVITADGLGDLKTGQPWTQARVEASRQLTHYSLLYRAHRGEWPRRLWIDSIRRRHARGATEWSHVRLWTYRTDEDRKAYIETVYRARSAIKAGAALPAPEGAWYCSQKWCPVWHVCRAVPKKGGSDV